MSLKQNRLSILNHSENQDLFGLPRFTQEDREQFFNISGQTGDLIKKNWPIHSKINFILQLGYFASKRMFFPFDMADVKHDVIYLLNTYFSEKSHGEIEAISKPTKIRQQQIICAHYGYRRYDGTIAQELLQLANQIVKRSAKPVFILKELLHYLDKHKVVVPAYSAFQDLIGSCLSGEKKRIGQQLAQSLDPVTEKALYDLLFENPPTAHLITQLKKEPKSFGYKQIATELERARYLKPLYDFAVRWISSLGISNESIRYYAGLVDYYSVYKLRRFEKHNAYYYLLCYAFHRTQVINDNLIDALINHVRKYEEEAKEFARHLIYQQKSQANEDIKKTGKVLELFLDPKIDDNTPFGEIRAHAFQVLNRSKMEKVTAYISTCGFDEQEYQWQHLELLSASIKKNLRPIIRNIDFKNHAHGSALIKAVVFLQSCFENGRVLRHLSKDRFPVQFIPLAIKKYLFTGKNGTISQRTLNQERYEFAVYKMLRKAFESGDVFNPSTTKYRSFTDYLIPQSRWVSDKQQILHDLDISVLSMPVNQLLQKLKDELEEKIERVNRRLISRDNKGIKLTGQKDQIKWSAPHTGEENAENHQFYHSIPTINIVGLLSYVNQKTGFFNGFVHILDRYVKGTKNEKTLLACIVALGTNMGLGRMGEISDVDYQELQTTYHNFFRLETLKESNDLIANSTAKLAVFRHYDIETDIIHSSSDGQRFETRIDTINARHSSKYFGLKKGISALTLIGNHVPINAKIIGTHEHESYFVFDLLYNNTTDIDPDRHSVDTHGTNQVNFWILYAFGYQFAPRYRDFFSKTEGIIGFQHPSHYDESFLIKPSRKIYEDLIVDQWPNIQHIMASLGQKETTQSAIVRKLSSYARQNETKKALWELDYILRSLYILDYIDDERLRKHVTKALNRGEAYHRLKRAIAHANSGKLRVKNEIEQHIIHECTRLIANAIIYFNAELLSLMMNSNLSENDRLNTEHIKKISPVAWQHINFYGRFEFDNIHAPLDIEELIKTINLPIDQNMTT